MLLPAIATGTIRSLKEKRKKISLQLTSMPSNTKGAAVHSRFLTFIKFSSPSRVSAAVNQPEQVAQ